MADAHAGTAGWDGVRLTQARQVAALTGADEDSWPAPEIGVADGFAQLRAAQRMSEALVYLAHALPRLEAVAWAIRLAEDAPAPDSPRVRTALEAARRWRDDQSERNRRAARAAGEEIARPVAERHLCAAVFYSGGSIAPAGHAPLIAPEHVAARYVAAAIADLAQRGDDPTRALEQALDLGEAVARRGMAALAR